jgi:L-ascorbate metabolism protein UlaG (beta-lactamase superfamily)
MSKRESAPRNLRSEAQLRGIRPRLELFGKPGRGWSLSDHFDGLKFFNPVQGARGLGDVLTWLRTRQPSRWPHWEDNPVFPPPVARFSESLADWQITFVNHATVLIQIGPWNFITDPVYSERCSPFTFAGPKRVRAPGVAMEDLPTIHAVLLSHNHYDHLDIRTLKWLAERDNPLLVTGLGNKDYLRRNGVHHVVELDWWESTAFEGLKIHFVPAQHFSGRGLRDRDLTLWGGLVVETPHGKCLFAGDTGYGPHFRAIHERLGPMRLALLPIGAYEPRWFMGPVHMNPDDAVKAHIDLQAQQSLAIHFNTFQLTDESMDRPVQDLRAAQAVHAMPEADFVVLKEGEGRVF